jgi:hypothetical protein
MEVVTRAAYLKLAGDDTAFAIYAAALYLAATRLARDDIE